MCVCFFFMSSSGKKYAIKGVEQCFSHVEIAPKILKKNAENMKNTSIFNDNISNRQALMTFKGAHRFVWQHILPEAICFVFSWCDVVKSFGKVFIFKTYFATSCSDRSTDFVRWPFSVAKISFVIETTGTHYFILSCFFFLA